ncbi:MAG: flotillin-like protein FloA [Planctomycetes bacterium]|nr:flotillin-like protein FloA [Planctomycetota bacterium]
MLPALLAMPEGLMIFIGVVLILAMTIGFWFFMKFFPVWLQANMSGVEISFGELLRMWLRKVDTFLVMQSMIIAKQAGVQGVTIAKLQSYYLQGGRVKAVIRAQVAADKARIPLTFDQACKIDRAGRDVLEAVRICANPIVINIPTEASGSKMLGAVAKDGIQMWVRARVTVRANIERLIGGASEETIIARVGEGIVASVGSRTSWEVLENPDSISVFIQQKGLDANTAFEIVSIDIADVDVGRNIGAHLRADQAEADLERARARAEERHAAAVATEGEWKAKIAENEALVTAAMREIPSALADSFRDGHMSLDQYYKLLNVVSDTRMREAIAGVKHDHTYSQSLELI